MRTKNQFELDPERLATTDEHGNRVYLYPEDVKGIWKNRRTILYWFLIGIYLVLPWIYVNGKPTLLIDIANREFTVLGSTLHGVEPILFFLILASGLFFIAFITSSFGRVWCGWACPQTVFIQAIFMKVESFIEGKARVRRLLDGSKLSVEKIFKKILKWLVFIIISLHIAHTFIGYFVGPRELFFITTQSPNENWVMFLSTMIVTGIILLDFGWFREQFCTIACPYGRIQSVMMDENSLVVSYDVKRGEPRRNVENVDIEAEGDCINCYNCVKVCPTGIDIRRGTQLECIACTQCIDACDDIMTKLKKKKGLIKYSSENEINGKTRKILSKRSILYLTVSILLASLFIYFLGESTKLQLVFLRDKVPFQTVESEMVINHFTLKISHQGRRSYRVRFQINDPELKDRVTVVTPSNPLILEDPEKKSIIFFRFSNEILNLGTRKIVVDIYDEISKSIVATKEVILVGPVN